MKSKLLLLSLFIACGFYAASSNAMLRRSAPALNMSLINVSLAKSGGVVSAVPKRTAIFAATLVHHKEKDQTAVVLHDAHLNMKDPSLERFIKTVKAWQKVTNQEQKEIINVAVALKAQNIPVHAVVEDKSSFFLREYKKNTKVDGAVIKLLEKITDKACAVAENGSSSDFKVFDINDALPSIKSKVTGTNVYYAPHFSVSSLLQLDQRFRKENISCSNVEFRDLSEEYSAQEISRILAETNQQTIRELLSFNDKIERRLEVIVDADILQIIKRSNDKVIAVVAGYRHAGNVINMLKKSGYSNAVVKMVDDMPVDEVGKYKEAKNAKQMDDVMYHSRFLYELDRAPMPIERKVFEGLRELGIKIK